MLPITYIFWDSTEAARKIEADLEPLLGDGVTLIVCDSGADVVDAAKEAAGLVLVMMHGSATYGDEPSTVHFAHDGKSEMVKLDFSLPKAQIVIALVCDQQTDAWAARAPKAAAARAVFTFDGFVPDEFAIELVPLLAESRPSTVKDVKRLILDADAAVRAKDRDIWFPPLAHSQP